MGDRIHIIPCHQAEAFAFIRQHHRHHNPPVGTIFQLAAARESDEEVCPVARRLDDGWTAEVTRVATDGTKNACSALYAAAWRAARAMGYRRLLTFTLDTEPGTSLKAAGWRCVGETAGKSWSVPSRPRVDKHPLQRRFRWEMTLPGRAKERDVMTEDAMTHDCPRRALEDR